MNIKKLDKLMDTLICPRCGGELKDMWSCTQAVSWLECTKCDFEYVYERG